MASCCSRLADRYPTWPNTWPALVRVADRYPGERLAAIDEEHTASGAHRTTEIPFPKWSRRMTSPPPGSSPSLAISMVGIAPEPASSSDARWCLAHYFAELGERFEERFDPRRTLPADSKDLMPPSGAFLLARLNGHPAGCGALKTLAPGIGEIVRMWVDRAHRGLGIGNRMLNALEEQAAALGHRRVRLYTNRSLDEAKAMYRDNGYVEIARYNDDPYADHWLEKRL